MFKVGVKVENNCVTISTNRKVLKKWVGPFARSIIDQIILKNYYTTENLYLCRSHIDVFLHQVSSLYQLALVYYNIEDSLRLANLAKDRLIIAEALLLQIRMSDEHLRQDEVFDYFLQNFPNYNYLKFYEIIELLENSHVIQKVEINSKSVFYDKNPEPHDHYYNSIEDRLYDCQDALKNFYKSCNKNIKNSVYYI